ncbi:MAG: hypothetical protein FWG47_03755 [Propionibacteriaceae bacterium]|nr:hypothetical protein [Propionibacteriaceae bacterium]
MIDLYDETSNFYAFVSPLKSIRCNWLPYDEGLEGGWSGGVDCEIDNTSATAQNCDDDDWNGYRVWVMSDAEGEVCSSSAMWGFEEDDGPPVMLEYGTSIADYPWACLSEVDGLTCWNTETFHGFKLSETEQLVW